VSKPDFVFATIYLMSDIWSLISRLYVMPSNFGTRVKPL